VTDSVISSPEPSTTTPPPLRAGAATIPRARGAMPTLTHGGITVGQFLGMHVTGAMFPLVAGILLFGWRALGTVLVVMASTAIGVAIWRRIGRRGRLLEYSHALWLALLLAMTLPAHLLSDSSTQENVIPWPILPAAGLVLAAMVWLLGGIGSGRVHPVLVTHLLLVALFGGLLVPHLALQRRSIFVGDLARAGAGTKSEAIVEPWIHAQPLPGRDAIRSEPPSQRLGFYTTGIERPEGSFLSLEVLLRDQMPPLEDLIVGGVPAPIGMGCQIAVIMGGLFLLYRGVIDWRSPLLIFLAAYACFQILPIPVVIRETSRDWHWLALRHRDVGLPLAITFANYETMASPLLLVAFFFATSPAVRPLARRARTIYALLVGVLSAVFQLYATVAIGPYLALLAVSLLTPAFDRWFTPKTLV
jgi:electron transport complex protein RnfD